MEILWSIFNDYLYFGHVAHGMRINSFVLMSNHFHLIAHFPNQNMSEAMGYFMGETSRQICRISGRINQIYGRRFHRSLITSQRYFRHAYKYVYRNPVKAGFCTNVEDYFFSSLHGKVGRSNLHFPVEEDTLLFNEDFCVETIQWLNRAPTKENDDEMRRALRRKVFQLPKNKNTLLPSTLETMEF
jgi:putative transposase